MMSLTLYPSVVIEGISVSESKSAPKTKGLVQVYATCLFVIIIRLQRRPAMILFSRGPLRSKVRGSIKVREWPQH